MGIASTLVPLLSMPLVSLQFALVFGFLAQRSQIARPKVFSAGGFGFVLGLVPSAFFAMANLLVIYSFL